MVTKALVLRNTQAQHTSEYLSDLVEKVLDEFEMKKEQVLCIITDNASNMLSMVEKLDAVTEEDNDSEVEPFNDDIDLDDGLLDNTA